MSLSHIRVTTPPPTEPTATDSQITMPRLEDEGFSPRNTEQQPPDAASEDQTEVPSSPASPAYYMENGQRRSIRLLKKKTTSTYAAHEEDAADSPLLVGSPLIEDLPPLHTIGRRRMDRRPPRTEITSVRRSKSKRKAKKRTLNEPAPPTSSSLNIKKVRKKTQTATIADSTGTIAQQSTAPLVATSSTSIHSTITTPTEDGELPQEESDSDEDFELDLESRVTRMQSKRKPRIIDLGESPKVALPLTPGAPPLPIVTPPEITTTSVVHNQDETTECLPSRLTTTDTRIITSDDPIELTATSTTNNDSNTTATSQHNSSSSSSSSLSNSSSSSSNTQTSSVTRYNRKQGKKVTKTRAIITNEDSIKESDDDIIIEDDELLLENEELLYPPAETERTIATEAKISYSASPRKKPVTPRSLISSFSPSASATLESLARSIGIWDETSHLAPPPEPSKCLKLDKNGFPVAIEGFPTIHDEIYFYSAFIKQFNPKTGKVRHKDPRIVAYWNHMTGKGTDAVFARELQLFPGISRLPTLALVRRYDLVWLKYFILDSFTLRTMLQKLRTIYAEPNWYDKLWNQRKLNREKRIKTNSDYGLIPLKNWVFIRGSSTESNDKLSKQITQTSIVSSLNVVELLYVISRKFHASYQKCAMAELGVTPPRTITKCWRWSHSTHSLIHGLLQQIPKFGRKRPIRFYILRSRGSWTMQFEPTDFTMVAPFSMVIHILKKWNSNLSYYAAAATEQGNHQVTPDQIQHAFRTQSTWEITGRIKPWVSKPRYSIKQKFTISNQEIPLTGMQRDEIGKDRFADLTTLTHKTAAFPDHPDHQHPTIAVSKSRTTIPIPAEQVQVYIPKKKKTAFQSMFHRTDIKKSTLKHEESFTIVLANYYNKGRTEIDRRNNAAYVLSAVTRHDPSGGERRFRKQIEPYIFNTRINRTNPGVTFFQIYEKHFEISKWEKWCRDFTPYFTDGTLKPGCTQESFMFMFNSKNPNYYDYIPTGKRIFNKSKKITHSMMIIGIPHEINSSTVIKTELSKHSIDRVSIFPARRYMCAELLFDSKEDIEKLMNLEQFTIKGEPVEIIPTIRRSALESAMPCFTCLRHHPDRDDTRSTKCRMPRICPFCWDTRSDDHDCPLLGKYDQFRCINCREFGHIYNSYRCKYNAVLTKEAIWPHLQKIGYVKTQLEEELNNLGAYKLGKKLTSLNLRRQNNYMKLISSSNKEDQKEAKLILTAGYNETLTSDDDRFNSEATITSTSTSEAAGLVERETAEQNEIGTATAASE